MAPTKLARKGAPCAIKLACDTLHAALELAHKASETTTELLPSATPKLRTLSTMPSPRVSALPQAGFGILQGDSNLKSILFEPRRSKVSGHEDGEEERPTVGGKKHKDLGSSDAQV